MTNKTHNIVNKPPKSKVVKVIKDDGDTRLLQKQTLKSKWNYFVVEHKKDKLAKSLARMNTIAEEIVLRNQLVNAGTVENFLLNTSSYINTAEKKNGIIENCHKNILRPKKQERK